MRCASLVLAVATLAAPVAAARDLAATERTPPTVLAIEHGEETAFLVRLDTRSLTPVSKRVPLGGFVCASAFSPNGRRLALAMCVDDVIQIVDAKRLRRLAAISNWNPNGYTSVLAWPAERRLVWLGADRVFTADPITRKRSSPTTLDGALIQAVERVGNTIVLLAAPSGEIGPARLVVVGADGRVRSITLTDARAGTTFDPSSTKGEQWRPGLALAPGRAFVVGAGDDPVVEVDLRTMAARYHRPERRRSLLTNEAKAKMALPGSSRNARWLGDGRLAVWGFERASAGADRVASKPVGLSLVDTRTWTIETIDARAEHVALAAGTLLATAPGAGLTAYSTEGGFRYRVFDGESVWVAATFGRRMFLLPPRGRMRIIDAPTGRLLGTRRSLPRILHDDYREPSFDANG